MFGFGTIINTVAVIAGGIAGVVLKKGIPENCQKILMQACGIATIFIGVSGTLKEMLVINGSSIETKGTFLLILSLVLGGLAGSLLSIEDRLERLGELLKKKLHSEKDTRFVEGFVTSTLVICIGAMAIVGAIEDGLTGNFSTLTAKAILDFVIVMIFASTLGKGVIFSALPLFLYQGAITILAAVLGDFMSPALISDISFIGSALIFCVGVNIAFGKKFNVGNLLPALLVPIIYQLF
ncbi:MAG: DUF554 domain-containing protein [Lachnospiraceae bacterium]|nr:DUF554 domain-containing protein [Lachnospiraceae bacterium]